MGCSGGRPATWLRACPIQRSSALSSRLGLWSRHRVVIGDLNQAASRSSQQNAATSGQRLTCEALRARPSPRRIRGSGGEGSDESGDIRAAALVRAAQNCQSARLPQQDRATRGCANTRYGRRAHSAEGYCPVRRSVVTGVRVHTVRMGVPGGFCAVLTAHVDHHGGADAVRGLARSVLRGEQPAGTE